MSTARIGIPDAGLPLKITIIDYDAGNLRNVQKALERLGQGSVKISAQTEDVERADVLVLPGVGAFQDGMRALGRLQLDEALRRAVLEHGKPLLGICLGMQLLAREGYEGSRCSGLGILPVTIHRLRSEEAGLRVPHMGWNKVTTARGTAFAGIPQGSDFYFAHSYHAVCDDVRTVAATCEYGHEFVAAVAEANTFATQFHLEKSQRYGLRLLEQFLKRSSEEVERRGGGCR